MQILSNPPEQCIRELLVECNLPSSDLETAQLEHFLACGAVESPKGIIGLELFGGIALLRSLAVAQAVRGRGCGKALVAAAEQYAQERGVHDLYLLTTTAEDYFTRNGYVRIQRDAAPLAIQGTKQYSQLCPDSATLMLKRI